MNTEPNEKAANGSALRWMCWRGKRLFVRHPLTGKRLWQLRLEIWWRRV